MQNSQGAIFFGLGIDMTEWRKNIEEIRRDITGLSNSTQRETQKMDNSFRNLSLGIGAYFSATALQGFAMQLINVRGEFQKTEIAFSTMLKSKEKAKVLMGEMVDLAAKTPFGLQEVTEGAKRLLAFQIPAEQVTETLRRMGDIAAGLGVPMGQLIHVYGQVKAQGKLMTNDLYQFMNAGIPILAELGKVMGKTEAEIKKMVGEGKIGFAEVQQVIQNMTNEGGIFFNLMEAQSSSLSGKVANLQDAFEQMLNKIGESNEGLLADGIEGLTYLVENYEKLGDILLVVISTYGAYKGALIATAAWNNIISKNLVFDIATRKLNIALTWAQVKAQLALNATMLANPVALAIAGTVALGAVMYTLSDSTDEATTAEEKLAKAREESRKKTEEEANSIRGYIQDIKSSTKTIYDKIDALKKLQEVAPEVFKDMTIPDIEKMGIDELNEKVNTFLSSKRANETKTQLEEVDKKIGEITERIKYMRAEDKGNAYLHIERGMLSSLVKEREVLVRKVQEEKDEHFRLTHTLEEQLAHWERIIQESENGVAMTRNLWNESDKVSTSLDRSIPILGDLTYGAHGFAMQLANAKRQAEQIKSALARQTIKDKKDYNKADWDNQAEEAQKKLNSMTSAQLKSAEAKAEREKIEEARRKSDEYNVRTSSNIGGRGVAPRRRGTSPSKELAEVFKKDSISDLEQRISLLNNALNRAFVDGNGNYIIEERIKDQHGKEKKSGNIIPLETALQQLKDLEAKREQVRKNLSVKSFEEELSETERQWRVRYKIAEKYGEEVAKAQFPDLKGESYMDEITNRFSPLDQKMKNGITLTDEELLQWEKLKAILSELKGEKDPFTNFKDNLDSVLSSLETSAERLEYLRELKDNLTSEQKDNGGEAEVNARIASEEEALKSMYKSFIDEHKSYEEKATEITKRYAQLRAMAQTEEEKKKIDEAEAEDKSKLELDFFKESGDWELAFSNLDYLAQSTIDRLIKNFEEFKKAKADTLQPTELKELNNAIEQLRSRANRNPLKGLIDGLIGTINGKKRVKKAQDEYNEAVNQFGANSDEAREKQEELTRQEIESAKAKQKLIEGINDVQGVFNALGEEVMNIADSFGGLDDASKDAIEDIMAIGNAALDLGAAIVSGKPSEMIKAGIKLIGDLFKALSGNKKKNRKIKKITEELEELKSALEELEDVADKALGLDKYANQHEQIKNLEEQKKKLEEIAEVEAKKKGKNKDKLKEYQEELRETERQIQSLYDEMINDLMQTDVASAAAKVGDALVDAFSRGEDAVKSLEKAANDMIKSILRNQINKALEKKIAPLIEQFIEQSGILNGDGNVSITQEMIDNFRAGIMGLEGVAQNLFDMLGDVMGEEIEVNSIKGSFEGMSEKTAGILEGQFNAIRMNTAEIVYMLRQASNNGFGIEVAKESLSALLEISYNTYALHSIKRDVSEINNRNAEINLQHRANGL